MTTQSELPRGVIFDMDGVLVDSEPFICKAGCMAYAELGLQVKAVDFVPFVGMGENRYLGGVAEKYHFPVDIDKIKKRTYDIYLEIIRRALEPLPGVHEFIGRCRTLGKKIAVASSADRRKVEGNLRQIGLAWESFDTVVCGEDVVHKKPDPEIFLLAAKRIGLPATECLVVEDAVSGVAAIKAAKARCLALTTSFSHEQLAGADFFAPNLAGVGQEVLHWKQ
jgi:beta-phosphoglucomutase